MKPPFKFTWAIWFLLAIHAVVVLAGFIAPYSFETQEREHPYAPPTRLHFVDCSGKFHFRPFVYVTKMPEGGLTDYKQDCSQAAGIEFFPQGDSYTILGMFSSNRHLFGVRDPANLFLIGTDGFGRDQFSRLLYGGQVSLLPDLWQRLFPRSPACCWAVLRECTADEWTMLPCVLLRSLLPSRGSTC
jgi:ABC-type dipeptide/oligopeptide/nickel transport system permease subunit